LASHPSSQREEGSGHAGTTLMSPIAILLKTHHMQKQHPIEYWWNHFSNCKQW